jgi:hypothetical protein
MSRLEHDLERDLRQIADRATPSPDAWASIQQRVADQDPIKETEIIMLMENTTTRRRWPLAAAAAAVLALVVAGIAFANRDGGEESPADVPTPTVVVDPQPEPDAIDAELAASPVPPEGAQIPPGRYSTDAFGVPATFEVPDVTSEPWTVFVDNREAIVLGYGANTFVAIKRIGSFYDADEARDPSITGLGSIPPDDIDRWIEANGMSLDEQSDVTVADRDTKYRRFTLPADAGGAACPGGSPPCLHIASSSADQQDFNPFPTTLQTALPTSVWIVELGEFEPLGISAYTADVDHQAWLDDLAPLIQSIELGEPAPAVEGGTARLSTFGDAALALPAAGQQVEAGRYASDAVGVPIEFDLGDGQTAPWTVVTDEPGGIQLISDETGREFVAIGRAGSWYDAVEARAEDTSGLGSIPGDDIDGWIEANGVIVVDASDVEVGGRDAKYRLVRLDTTPGATAEFCPPEEVPCLWAGSGSADLIDDNPAPIPFGRDRVQALWLVDMGEFEPVVVFAAANLDDDGPWFTDVVQPIVDSITFGEPAPVVPGGTARVPERVTVSATMTVNQTGERDPENPWPLERTGELTGDITGTYTASGISSPNSSEITLDWTMDVTIDGLGSGTLTLRSYWFWSGDGYTTTADHVVGGTGDFAGWTGFGTGVQTTDFGFGNEFHADIELQLAPPAN